VGEVVLLSCSSAYAYGDAGAPPLIPPGADMVFELEVVSVRNLQSSHNPEEVDFLAKYNEIVENRNQRARSKSNANTSKSRHPVETPTQVSGSAAATAANAIIPTSGCGKPLGATTGDVEVGKKEADDAGSASTTPKRPSAWVPSRIEICGEHASGYSWRETDDEMEATFELPMDACKADVSCTITSSGVQLLFRGATLLDGELAGRADPEGSAWAWEEAESDLPQLVLTVGKREQGLWGYLMLLDRVLSEEDAPPAADGPIDGDDEPTASMMQKPGVDYL